MSREEQLIVQCWSRQILFLEVTVLSLAPAVTGGKADAWKAKGCTFALKVHATKGSLEPTIDMERGAVSGGTDTTHRSGAFWCGICCARFHDNPVRSDECHLAFVTCVLLLPTGLTASCCVIPPLHLRCHSRVNRCSTVRAQSLFWEQ